MLRFLRIDFDSAYCRVPGRAKTRPGDRDDPTKEGHSRMETRDLNARLLVIEALVMFLVSDRYVQIARQNRGVNIFPAVRQELRQWFDQLVDAPGMDPAAIEQAAVRVIANVEQYVAERLRG